MPALPAEMFVKSVEGDSDLFAFAFPMEQKALEDGQTVTEEENGDLVIEGYAAIFEGDDRQGENFAPGAFTRAAKSFVDGQGALCFHHKHDHVLGKVFELAEDGKGLKMKARVDGAIKEHPVLKTYYSQIKSGTLNGLSVGGFFKRAEVDGKTKIADMDFTEISVTGVPVHTGPSFAVVAGKALTTDVEIPAVPDVDGEVRADDVRSIQYIIQELNSVFTRIQNGVAKRGEGSATPPTPPSYDL